MNINTAGFAHEQPQQAALTQELRRSTNAALAAGRPQLAQLLQQAYMQLVPGGGDTSPLGCTSPKLDLGQQQDLFMQQGNINSMNSLNMPQAGMNSMTSISSMDDGLPNLGPMPNMQASLGVPGGMQPLQRPNNPNRLLTLQQELLSLANHQQQQQQEQQAVTAGLLQALNNQALSGGGSGPLFSNSCPPSLAAAVGGGLPSPLLMGNANLQEAAAMLLAQQQAQQSHGLGSDTNLFGMQRALMGASRGGMPSAPMLLSNSQRMGSSPPSGTAGLDQLFMSMEDLNPFQHSLQLRSPNTNALNNFALMNPLAAAAAVSGAGFPPNMGGLGMMGMGGPPPPPPPMPRPSLGRTSLTGCGKPVKQASNGSGEMGMRKAEKPVKIRKPSGSPNRPHYRALYKVGPLSLSHTHTHCMRARMCTSSGSLIASFPAPLFPPVCLCAPFISLLRPCTPSFPTDVHVHNCTHLLSH